MPIGRYYHGSGESVMKDMKSRYGPKKGESVFYAKANKNPQLKPVDSDLKKSMRAAMKGRGKNK